jgi:hypothetical protein
MRFFGFILTVRTPGTPQYTRRDAYRASAFPGYGIGSGTSTIEFGTPLAFTAVSAAKPPCLRFAMAVSGHHVRLGTRLRARLCRGLHFRRLNFMSFKAQPTQIPPKRNPHTGLPPWVSDGKAIMRLGMTLFARPKAGNRGIPNLNPFLYPFLRRTW